MKLLKRTVVMALAIMMLMSILVLPASAVLSTPYYSHVCAFHELYNGSPENAYIRAAQCFLYRFSTSTRNTIINGGGIDGGYGNATMNAVKEYQSKKWPYNRDEWDGRVGTKTWTKIAGDLYDTGDDGYHVDLCCNGGKVLYVDLRAAGYSYYNCNASGGKDRLIVQR